MATPQAEQEFGPAFSDAFYVVEVNIFNRTKSPVLIYAGSLDATVRYFYAQKDYEDLIKSGVKRAKETSGETDTTKLLKEMFPDGQEFFIRTRRPSTYSDILAAFEYQRKSNGRQQGIDWLKTAGEIASGAGVFLTGQDYSKGVMFVTGIITPELEKRILWDILLHAKNLESRGFKEIEEIPALTPMHKLVFFPKGPIPAVGPKNVYISQIGNADVTVTGATISKRDLVEGKTK